MNEPVRTDSPQETEAFGQQFAERITTGDCVCLTGPLGAGKTVLARGIAAGLGVSDTGVVCSPTYVLVHEYAGRIPVYHLDLYRLGSPAEFVDLAVEEMLADGVVLIEWPQRARGELPLKRWEIVIEIVRTDERLLAISRRG